ncbi:hypothetical protein FRC18_001713 [Serendipita sp. 400]|nr:hypothetical protein FRC18_001713 [Serendipita sp. 400]
MFLELEPYYILQQKPIVRYRLEGLTGMKEESNVTKVSRLEKLEDERAQLLITLSTAQTTIDGSIPASSISAILRLKEENNRLIDERLKIMRTDSTVRDPSCLLPVEIFVHIIDSAIFDALISGWCTETLLSYTLVSTRWRDILMSTPSLWGYVLLKDIDTPYFKKCFSSLCISPGTRRLSFGCNLLSRIGVKPEINFIRTVIESPSS